MEKQQDLYITFVDLTKAFDRVSREGLWKSWGSSDALTIVRQFHDGMMACVLDNGEASNALPVTNGIKQGCVRTPTLFSMMCSAMLTDAFRDSNPSVHIKHMFDDKLFNLKSLQAVTRVKETVIREACIRRRLHP